MSPLEVQRKFFEMLMESQYWPTAAMVDYQRSQLSQLLRHARQNVPFYAGRLDSVFTPQGDIAWDRWEEIPIVTRADMAQRRDEMLALTSPPGHGATGTVETSGSSGRPVKITTNLLTAVAANGNRWRAHRTYDLDWSATYTARDGHSAAAAWPHGERLGAWGPPWDDRARIGNAYRISRATNTVEMLEFLARTGSAYLSTGPKQLYVYALESERLGVETHLECALVHGEAATAAEIATISRVFGARVMETYGSKEAGQIGYPCRHGRGLHLNAESVLVEIVDADGRAVAPGEVGRVVVTPFVSTAQPLIRYDQGDFARAGGRCGCGRSLPMIEAVEGRSTAVFTHPDGRRVARMLDESARDLLQCHFWQVAQTGPRSFELRYVPRANDSIVDEPGIIALFRATYFDDADVELVRVREIPLTPAGKLVEYLNSWEPET